MSQIWMLYFHQKIQHKMQNKSKGIECISISPNFYCKTNRLYQRSGETRMKGSPHLAKAPGCHPQNGEGTLMTVPRLLDIRMFFCSLHLT